MRLVSIICWLSLLGCTGELVPTSGSAGGGTDGGGSTSLAFRPTIQEDLSGIGCASSSCHGSDAVPMPLVVAPATEDEWRDNYNQVMARAGTQSTSLLISKASGAGGHVASLDAEDPMLERWRSWIAAGTPYEEVSPDQPDGGSDLDASLVDASVALGLTWDRDISPIMGARCTRCHGTQGAYSLESYQAALGFGRDAIPNILPGNPLSLLLQYCEQGHEGIGAAEALLVVEWVVDWNASER